MITMAIVTVSDRSSRGERADLSGPEIRSWAEKMKDYTVVNESIVPDDLNQIKNKLMELGDAGIMLIVTTGGTGFAPRDVTPEATLAVVTKLAPGIAEAMRMKSLQITPHAMLSRAVAGIYKSSLIINLPGSPKAVRENLAIFEGALTHGIGLINAKISDCGSVD